MPIRFEAARHLLSSRPHLSVGVIAHRCGLRKVSHFSRRYRLAYRMTPVETRLYVDGRDAGRREGPAATTRAVAATGAV